MIRKRILSLTLALLMAASLFTLSGCGNNKKMCDDLNNDGSLAAAVASNVSADYIDLNDLQVTKVEINETTDIENGKVYRCDITVSNPYISVTLDGDLVYTTNADGDEQFAQYSYSAADTWIIKAVSGIKADLMSNDDLPNADNLQYDNFTVGKVNFDEDKQTCSVETYLSVNQDYVIASGIVLVNYSFENGKWTHTDCTTGDEFSMSWNIGGLWEGDEYKWNERSDMRLKYGFDIKSIDSEGKADIVVYSHIFTGRAQHQIDDFEVEGAIDFTTMSLTVDFDKHKQLSATIKNGEFIGSIIDKEDGFSYYTGHFTKE